ncbi:hypothetical protein [Arsenicicoccus bolidensis]|uniref:hypothetical protein n=1 Tax=Arsenicicoccus bolidensis TaxID=229480 RepID=UPI0028B23937|nr:hypothetical protein [Arsenicicoccus bolidensis]
MHKVDWRVRVGLIVVMCLVVTGFMADAWRDAPSTNRVILGAGIVLVWGLSAVMLAVFKPWTQGRDGSAGPSPADSRRTGWFLLGTGGLVLVGAIIGSVGQGGVTLQTIVPFLASAAILWIGAGQGRGSRH